MSPLSYCLRLIKQRLRSRFELDQAMERKGFELDERVRVLDELTEHQLVDDWRFARAWIHTRDNLAPRGEFLLRHELKQKGISEEIIQAVLLERKQEGADEGQEQLSEEELARQLLQRYQKRYARLTPESRQRRVAALLSRRGFSSELIRRIVNT